MVALMQNFLQRNLTGIRQGWTTSPAALLSRRFGP